MIPDLGIVRVAQFENGDVDYTFRCNCLLLCAKRRHGYYLVDVCDTRTHGRELNATIGGVGEPDRTTFQFNPAPGRRR